jgi:hypothetical protein
LQIICIIFEKSGAFYDLAAILGGRPPVQRKMQVVQTIFENHKKAGTAFKNDSVCLFVTN